MNKREFIFCFLNSLIALIIGLIIYIYIDVDSYLANLINGFIKIEKIQISSNFFQCLRNWGGDFLWSFSLFFSLAISVSNKFPVKTIALISILFSIIIESLQLIKINNIKCGTFDIYDIISSCFAIWIGLLVLYAFKYIDYRKGGRQ